MTKSLPRCPIPSQFASTMTFAFVELENLMSPSGSFLFLWRRQWCNFVPYQINTEYRSDGFKFTEFFLDAFLFNLHLLVYFHENWKLDDVIIINYDINIYR